jgi:hypothetical protein
VNPRSCWRRLTLRSTGEPTAGHHARAGGTPYIFTGPGLAACRCLPVNSNVRPQKMRSCAKVSFPAPSAAMREAPIQTAATRTASGTTRHRSPLREASMNPFYMAFTYAGARYIVKLETLTPASSSQLVVRASRRRAAPRKVFVGRAARTMRGLRTLARRVRLAPESNQLARARWWPTALAPRSVLHSVANASHASRGSLRSNPSFNRRANGRPPGPGRRYVVHFRQPGPGVLPSSPG